MTKRVSIIITTYLEESKPYLDACIDSVLNLNYPQHLLDVILVGKKSYQPQYPGVETVAPDTDDFGNSEGMNFGAKHADDPDFYLFLNDDVILTRDSLKNMVVSAGNESIILGPISNCDQGIKYYLFTGNNPLPNQLRFKPETHAEAAKELSEKSSVYPPGIILQSHLYFYAVLIPAHVWHRVGEFDSSMKTGPDDLDFSRRAQALGIPCGICLDSLIFHCSGVTADKTLTLAMREENARVWEAKWGEKQTFGG